MIWIGIDNGVSGSIGIISPTGTKMVHAREYTRKKKRGGLELDAAAFKDLILQDGIPHGVVLERPFTGQHRNVVVSAAHFDSVARTVMELNGIPFIQVDSTDWQRPLLKIVRKKGVHADTKRVSMEAGVLRWPSLRAQIEDQGDADALFLAVHAMHEFPGGQDANAG